MQQKHKSKNVTKLPVELFNSDSLFFTIKMVKFNSLTTFAREIKPVLIVEKSSS